MGQSSWEMCWWLPPALTQNKAPRDRGLSRVTFSSSSSFGKKKQHLGSIGVFSQRFSQNCNCYQAWEPHWAPFNCSVAQWDPQSSCTKGQGSVLGHDCEVR